MRKLYILTTALLLTVGASAAQATSVIVAPAASTDAVVQVSGGCGPGGHRDFRGFCRPNGYGRPIFRCPPYTHPTPYGCRRNY